MKKPSKPAIEGLDLEPAFVNIFNVLLNPAITRIALGEFFAGDVKTDARFRHAFVMPTGDAITLANLILTLANQNEAINTPPSTMQ